MKNLGELLRQLFYLVVPTRQAAGRLVATAVLAFTGYNVLTSGHGLAPLAHVAHLLDPLVNLIGSAVIFNIFLKHGNELLEVLLRERTKTETETRRFGILLKTLFGFRSPDRPDSDTNSSKNDNDSNKDTSK